MTRVSGTRGCRARAATSSGSASTTRHPRGSGSSTEPSTSPARGRGRAFSHQRPKVSVRRHALHGRSRRSGTSTSTTRSRPARSTIFVGTDFVVTVRHGEGVDLAASARDLEPRRQGARARPIGVMYAICDRVVDEYERVGAALDTDVDEVRSLACSTARTDDSPRIYILKRRSRIPSCGAPLHAPMQKFATPTHRQHSLPRNHHTGHRDLSATSRPPPARLKVVDTLDELLSTAFDARLARISVDKNEDMRRSPRASRSSSLRPSSPASTA